MSRNNETGKGFDIDAAAAIEQLEKEKDRRFAIGSIKYKWYECVSIMDDYQKYRPAWTINWGFIPQSNIFTRIIFAIGSMALTFFICQLFTKRENTSNELDTLTTIVIYFIAFAFVVLSTSFVTTIALESDKLVNIMRFRNIIADEHYMLKDYQATLIIGIIIPAINAGMVTTVVTLAGIYPLIPITAYIITISLCRKEFIEIGRHVNTFFPSEILKKNHPHE